MATFVRADRSLGLRFCGAGERRDVGRGQRLAVRREHGVVRTGEHTLPPERGAVAAYEQVRSEIANKTTLTVEKLN
jgi:hypothetical protein